MGRSYTCRSGRTQEGEAKGYQSCGGGPTELGEDSACHALFSGRGAVSVAAREKDCCWRNAEGTASKWDGVCSSSLLLSISPLEPPTSRT